MIVHRLAAVATLSLCLAVPPALAASFDCSKASTPFEHAICDSPELSRADEVLAKAFSTATGGLTKPSVTQMRTDQRNWLDYAQRACTDDAEPLPQAERYGEQGVACLVDKFKARNRALENSRMLGGHRFFLSSSYAALPDPYEVDNPESYWKVASHDLVLTQLDADDPLAPEFNAYMSEQATFLSTISTLGEGETPDEPASSTDTTVTVAVKEVAGTGRITLAVNSYWFGHGAAHGDPTVSYLHYFIPEQRGLIASDVFSGDDWASTLVDLAWAQLQAEHQDWLMIESAADIAEIVVEPTRWDFSDDYGLVIQFQPYEVAAYAYGTPTVTIPWEKLEGITANSLDTVRYGF